MVFLEDMLTLYCSEVVDISMGKNFLFHLNIVMKGCLELIELDDSEC